jgi:hypothetical protein
VKDVISKATLLWLIRKIRAGKKTSPGCCVKKSITSRSGRKRIIYFHQKSAADKRDVIWKKHLVFPQGIETSYKKY